MHYPRLQNMNNPEDLRKQVKGANCSYDLFRPELNWPISDCHDSQERNSCLGKSNVTACVKESYGSSRKSGVLSNP